MRRVDYSTPSQLFIQRVLPNVREPPVPPTNKQKQVKASPASNAGWSSFHTITTASHTGDDEETLTLTPFPDYNSPLPWKTRSTIERGRGCNKLVPVLRGNGTKIAPTGDICVKPPGEMSWIRGKLANHVGDHAVLSPEEVVLVTSSGTELSHPRPSQSLNNSEDISDSFALSDPDGLGVYVIRACDYIAPPFPPRRWPGWAGPLALPYPVY